MAGKNHIEKSLYIFIDDSGGTPRNLTNDLIAGSLFPVGFEAEEVDMHGVGESVKTALTGYLTAGGPLKFHMNDTATTGAFTVLKAAPYNGTVTVQFGQNGSVPTTGDPEFEGEFSVFPGPVTMESGRAIMTVTVRPQSGQAAPAWGTV